MFLLSEAGSEDIDVVVVRILVDLVEDNDPGAQAVFSLRAVGAALDDRPGLDAGDLFLCPVIEPLDLLRDGRNFKESDQILRWPDCLLLVIRTDIHIILADPVVWTGQEEALCRDRAILAGSSSQHTEQIRPSRLSGIIPVGAVMQSDGKLLPGKQRKRKVRIAQVHIMLQLVLIDMNRLGLKAVPYMLHKEMLLLTALELILLDNIDPFLDFRREFIILRCHLPGPHQVLSQACRGA